MTRTWAGSPSRIATSEGPWDSPAVSHRSMGEVSQPHMRAASAVPQTRPTSAPPTMNGPKGNDFFSRDRSRRDDGQRRAPGARTSMKPTQSADQPARPTRPSRAPARPARRAGRRRSPCRPSGRTTAPRRTTGRRDHRRRGPARGPRAPPSRGPPPITASDRGEGGGYDDDAGQQAGVPVDHRQGDRDRGQRHQPEQRPVEPGGRAEQRPRHGRRPARCATRDPAGRRCRRRASWAARRPRLGASSAAFGFGAGSGTRAISAGTSRPPSPASRAATSAASAGSVRVSVTRVIQPAWLRRKGAFARFAHRVERRRPSGEQLDLQHRLVHEQVQPADQTVPARAAAATSGVGHGSYERLEDDRHVGAAARPASGVWADGGDGRHHDVGDDGSGAQRRHARPRARRVRPQRGDGLRRPGLVAHQQLDRGHAEVDQREPDRGGRRATAEDRRPTPAGSTYAPGWRRPPRAGRCCRRPGCRRPRAPAC